MARESRVTPVTTIRGSTTVPAVAGTPAHSATDFRLTLCGFLGRGAAFTTGWRLPRAGLGTETRVDLQRGLSLVCGCRRIVDLELHDRRRGTRRRDLELLQRVGHDVLEHRAS